MSDKEHNAASPHIENLDIASAMREPPPDLDLVLPGMISGTVGSIVAPGGTGKSWLALEIAAAVAGGPDLAKIGVPAHGEVLYLPAEDPKPALIHRLHVLGQHASRDERAAIIDRLRVAPLTGHTSNILDPAWRDAITDQVAGARLLILDTIRRFHDLEENNSGEMAKLLDVMETLCDDTGVSILFLHHMAKGATLNGAGDQQQASRGSSVLVDNVRGGQFNLSGMTEVEAQTHGVNAGDRRHFVKLVQVKANFGAPIPNMWFRRENGGILLPAQIAKSNDSRRQAKPGTNAQGKSWRYRA